MLIHRSFRRYARARLARATLLVLFAALLIDAFTILRTRLRQASSVETHLPAWSGKLFVASTHWNNEAILRSHWNTAILALAEHLGKENIYISVLEGGSWDNSKGALRLLDVGLEQLGVRRTIILEDKTHADEIAEKPAPSGWIDTARGQKELRRIPFLSKLRNRSLEPLEKLASEGVLFDRILFLNDVVFNTQDVMSLLSTRDGDYAAACSLDFSKPPEYYDTFALRDFNGDEAVMSVFPYFRASASRDAMIAGRPVPVRSCWNGMVVFDPTPFYGPSPIRFRGIADSLAEYHLEASECCLIHADNPLTNERGVWLNPAVRVGYNADAYLAIHEHRPWPMATESLRGVWRNRMWRWLTPQFHKALKVKSRLKRWRKKHSGAEEPGTHCLINEMQVLVANGWAHV